MENQTTSTTLTLDTLSRTFFTADDLAAGKHAELLNSVTDLQAAGVPVIFNCEAGVPTGFGLAIVPMAERKPDPANTGKNITVNTGVVVLAFPSLEHVQAVEGGPDWINSAITSALVSKALMFAKRSGSLPVTTEEFIASAEREAGVSKAYTAAFNAVATYLRQKHPASFGKAFVGTVLRSVCESSEFGKLFAHISPKNWEAIFAKVRLAIQAEGATLDRFEEMLANRDTAAAPLEELGEIEL